MMNYSQFVKQENFENVYTFGGDSFLMQKVVEFFIKKFELNSYDISYFDADNFLVDKLIESCEQVSFFSTKRLVVVKNLNTLPEGEKKKLNSYIKKINPNCTLLLYDSFNKGLFNLPGVSNVELSLYDNEMATFVKKQFEKNGKQINFDAVQELISCCNKDLNTINNEIAKLCAYCNDKTEISLTDISLLVPANEEIVVFELTTALGERNSKKSLELLYKLMGNVEQNSKLFSLMSNTFQRMFFALVSKDMTDKEVADKFGVKEFAIKKCRMQAKNFSAPKLKNIVYEFCDVEYMVKNGYFSIENALVYMTEYILYK